MYVPSLRAPSEKLAGIVYFGRMIDKIRIHARGELPEDYIANLGGGFDERCCKFLKVSYSDLVTKATSGESDEAILEWCFQNGHKPNEEEIEVWNGFMTKRGWKDSASPMLQKRLNEAGFSHRTDIETMFQMIEADEARP